MGNAMNYITKGIGGFYYVKTPDGIKECKARGIFRKSGIKPVAGDWVELSPDGTVIDEIRPRKNGIYCESKVFESVEFGYNKIVEQMIEEGMVASACAVGYGGIAEALFKMGLGNRIGFKMRADMPTHRMFEPMYGSIVLEMVSDSPAGELLGETTREYTFESCGETLDMAELQEIWESKLEPVYPYRKAGPTVEKINGKLNAPAAPKIGVAKPKVIIPVFPGTNCEYDTAKAFAIFVEFL